MRIVSVMKERNINNYSLSILLFFFCLFRTTIVITVTGVEALSATTPTTTKVAVLGGTGRLGQQTVRQLIDKNIPVRCLVRPGSNKNIPKDWENEPLIEIIQGELLLLDSETGQPTKTVGDDTADPSLELIECLQGCNQCIATYGATRRTKISDFFNADVENSDPNHSKQINYRSIQGLLKACNSSTNNSCKHIIRITGKGENPTGLISILINLIGSLAKGWNYEGEELLRTQSTIGYTIIRPGVMKEKIDIVVDNNEKDDEDDSSYWGWLGKFLLPKSKKDDDSQQQQRYLELSDDGGNDLKVSAVEYKEIGELIVNIVEVTNVDNNSSWRDKSNKIMSERRITVAAMNVEGIPKEKGRSTLQERVLALRNDRREFPKSLISEHKKAVNGFVKKLALIGTIGLTSFIWLIFKLLF